jgi:hypothetical protein
MAQELFVTFLLTVEVLRPAVTRPGFENLRIILIGWIQDPGAVTQALVATWVSGRTHHERFHRFFSRGAWSPDMWGRQLFLYLVKCVPSDQPIRVAIDDTLALKKGPEVFGIGCHLDAVRSTALYRVFAFGHCWVVLAALVHVPFSNRVWALPLLFRLYRTKKSCADDPDSYRKKTELAREMIDVLLRWVDDGRSVEIVGDSAYCNHTVTHDLPAFVIFIGDMRPDAVLTDKPLPRQKGQRGRTPLRGSRLSTPTALAEDKRSRWKRCTVVLKGAPRTVYYKDCWAQWYRACGTRWLHIIIVKVTTGRIPFRIFFSTDATMAACDILQRYTGRWAIEVTFCDLKQLLGFADSSARKQAAVERTAPFVGYTFTLLVLWFTTQVVDSSFIYVPVRPWYQHKTGYAFSDILRTARKLLATVDVLDLPNGIEDLHKYCLPAFSSSTQTTPMRC